MCRARGTRFALLTIPALKRWALLFRPARRDLRDVCEATVLAYMTTEECQQAAAGRWEMQVPPLRRRSGGSGRDDQSISGLSTWTAIVFAVLARGDGRVLGRQFPAPRRRASSSKTLTVTHSSCMVKAL